MALVFKRIVEGYHYVNDELSVLGIHYSHISPEYKQESRKLDNIVKIHTEHSRKTKKRYNMYILQCTHPRSNHMILLNPFVILGICVLYYKFVKHWGPAFMKNREPYKIEKLIMVYNAIQILLCGNFTYQATVEWFKHYNNFRCQPLAWDESPVEMLVVKFVRHYFYFKLLDMMDTVFFVFRKKNSHISFLHVYHHIVMVFCGWMGVKYVPGGHGAMLAIVNSFVHTIMYGYYLCTLIYPQYKNSLWWKKHLTQLQILQFAFLMIHFGHPLLQPNCTFPKWISCIFLPQNMFMTIMFSDFYYKQYIKKKKHT